MPKSKIWTANLEPNFQRVNDPDIQSSVIEVEGENVATNYITCPMNASDSLGN